MDIETVVKQVQQAIKDGSVDAALEASREACQKAMDALAKAERVPWLRPYVSIH
jgi:ribosomal protein S20